DAIERRAQLMAHLADEDALGVIGAFRHGLRCSELRFGGNTIRNFRLELVVRGAKGAVGLLELVLVVRAFHLGRGSNGEQSECIHVRIGPVALAVVHHGEVSADAPGVVLDRNAEIALHTKLFEPYSVDGEYLPDGTREGADLTAVYELARRSIERVLKTR